MLKIKEIKIKGEKKVKQCPMAKVKAIPSHPHRSYIVGCSGSGKTNLLLNLLTRDGFYKDWYDLIIVISPTSLNLDKSYEELEKETKYKNGKDLLYFEPDVEVLKTILEMQEETEKEKKVLVILDDFVSYKKFTNSHELLRFAIMSRHYNISMMLLSQCYYLVPKSVRLNMSACYYFRGNMQETETMAEMYCPSGMRKKDFIQLIEKATEEPYSFIHINTHIPLHDKIPRYRAGLEGNLLSYKK
jgi:hypothetical protein